METDDLGAGKKALKSNLERVAKLVDNEVTFLGSIPLFNWLEISPVELCNRRCVFCPKSDESVAPNLNLHMSLDLAAKLADELRTISYGGTVMLAGYGEPLLHRSFLDLVHIFAAVARTEVTTNGDQLTPELARDLIDAGIAKIVVSMYDGPQQIAAFTELFARAGIPADNYLLRDRWYTAENDFGVKLTNRAGVVKVGGQPEVTQRPCYYPHYSLMLDWNGNVYMCTQDWNRRAIMGNFAFEPLCAIWNNAILRKYRKMLFAGKRTMTPCATCNADGTLHGEKHAIAWNQLYAGSAEGESS